MDDDELIMMIDRLKEEAIALDVMTDELKELIEYAEANRAPGTLH